MLDTGRRNWWPHVELRTATYWRGQAWLFRLVPEATLEFADRTEIYELESSEFRRLSSIPYQDRIGELLRRRPDRVVEKVTASERPFVSE